MKKNYCERFNMECPYMNECMDEHNNGMPCPEQEFEEVMEEMQQALADEYIERLKREMDFYWAEFNQEMIDGRDGEISVEYFINQSILHDFGIEYDPSKN